MDDRDPCGAGCQFGHGAGCHSRTSGHRRFCVLAATDPSYRRYVEEKSRGDGGPAPLATDADAVRLRRAAKPRVPLGTRPKPGGG